MRRVAIVSAALLALTGCVGSQFEDGLSFKSVPVDVPQQSEASVAVAVRVDQVGRQLLAQNPFLGVEPTFHTLGRPDPELFHRDTQGVFITEGLVQRCGSDEELAAVLASELGAMAAERRTAERMRVAEPMAAALPATADQNQLGVQAVFDAKLRAPDRDTPRGSDDPKQLAAEILKSAGHDPSLMGKVAPYLQEASRHSSAAQQLGVRGDRPRWTR